MDAFGVSAYLFCDLVCWDLLVAWCFVGGDACVLCGLMVTWFELFGFGFGTRWLVTLLILNVWVRGLMILVFRCTSDLTS